MLAVGGIDKADQILVAELMLEVGDLDLADGDRLRIIGDRARHLEQRADGHVFPCRILRQPFPDRVVELELACASSLRIRAAVNALVLLPMSNRRVGADWLFVAEPVVAGIDRKDRFARAAIHLQRGARKPLDRPALLDVGVKDLLQLRGEGRIIGPR